jgi:hypothetical protein
MDVFDRHGAHELRIAIVEVEAELGQAADRCPGLSVFK